VRYDPALLPKNVARYDSRPVPVDPSLLAALKWRRERAQRIAAANAARPAPAASALVGSRYVGGASFAARSR
jgi:hypothetical protein